MTITVRSNENFPLTQAAQKLAEGPAKEPKDANSSAPEAKAPEQKEVTESDPVEPEETETPESTELDGDPESKDESEKPEETESVKTKKKGGFQKRIDKLSAKASSAQQEAEYWKQLALKNAGSDPKSSPVDKAPSQAIAGKPDPEKFETHAEYVEALTDWKTDQKLNERDQKAAKANLEREQAERSKSYAERVKAFSAKTEDWADAMENLDDVPRSPALETIILESDRGPELLYELGKNPAEAKRIASLPPLAQAREMGKIEARLTSVSSESKTEPKKITSAPKPLEPVGTGGKGAVRKSLDEVARTGSQAEYEKLRREQIKRRQA